MNDKREKFSHGYGALLRSIGAWRNRLIIAVSAALAGGIIFGLLIHKLTLSEEERTFIGWRMEAHMRAWAPTAHGRRMTIEWDGKENTVSASDVLAFERGIEAGEKARFRWILSLIFGGGAGLYFASGVITRISAQGEQLSKDRHLRGTAVMEEKELAELSAKYSREAKESGELVKLGGVPIARKLEQRNFLIAGTVGAGKTTAIRQLADTAERRGEAVVMYDPSGDLIAAYYNPDRGDVILNPYDARAASWDLFAEVDTWPDAKLMAACLVQPAPGQRPDEWIGYTRDLVGDVIWKLKTTGRGTIAELLRVLGFTEKADLAKLLDDMPSRRYFEDGADRATASAIFGFPAALAVLSSMRREPGSGGVFSWAEWGRRMDEKGGRQPWVFMGAPEKQFASVRPLIAAWVNCAAANVLSLAPSHERRVWLMVDEFASLPAMEVVPRLSAMGRKYGAALVLGIQSPSQLQEVYGNDGATTLMATAGTQLILRLPGGDAARWAAGQLGKQEIERRQASDVYETQEAADASTLVVSREIRDLVLDTEVAELPDLAGFIRVPSIGVGRVSIPTGHLARPRGEALIPVAAGALWMASLSELAPKPAKGEAVKPESPAEPAAAPVPVQDLDFSL